MISDDKTIGECVADLTNSGAKAWGDMDALGFESWQFNAAMDIARNLAEDAFISGLKAGLRQWVSTRDRLPDKTGCYLAFRGGGGIQVLFFSIVKPERWTDGDEDDNIGNVSHWMPLPPAPEKEE